MSATASKDCIGLFLIVALLNVVKYESSEDVFVSFEETEKKPQNVLTEIQKYLPLLSCQIPGKVVNL